MIRQKNFLTLLVLGLVGGLSVACTALSASPVSAATLSMHRMNQRPSFRTEARRRLWRGKSRYTPQPYTYQNSYTQSYPQPSYPYNYNSNGSVYPYTNTLSSITGTVSSISGSSITMYAQNGMNYTLDASVVTLTDASGNSLPVTSVQTGDSLTVYGTIQSNSITNITRLQDTSRTSTYVTGTITAVNYGSVVIQNSQSGNQTIYFGNNLTVTKNGQSDSISDLTVGTIIGATGVTNNGNTGVTVNAINVIQSMNGYNPTNYNNNPYSYSYPYNYYQNSDSNGNPTVSISLSPYASTLSSGQTTNIVISGADTNGVSTLNMFANGILIQSCTLTNTPSSASCSASIYGGNYSIGSTVVLYGQMVDRNGNTSNSNAQDITIQP